MSRLLRLSLIQRFLLLFFLGFTVTTTVTVANLVVGYRLKDNAVAINLSGQCRYRSYQLYYLYNEYRRSDQDEKKLAQQKLLKKMSELKAILYGLRYGNSKLKLKPSGQVKINTALDKLINNFQADIQPTIVKSLNKTSFASTREDDKEIKIIGAKLNNFVYEVDKVVLKLQSFSESQVLFLQNVQIGLLALLMVAAVLIIIALIYWIKRPIYKVIVAMEQLEAGNFNLHLPEERGDELGQLARGFNHMAAELKKQTAKLKKLSENLRVQAITDGLTGLYNHRYFYEVLHKELNRAKRHKRNFSVILLDLDYFKKFNDTFGHLAGDQALKKVAKLIVKQIRTTDYAFRYGGEEMALILPETSKKSALILGEKIRLAIQKQEFIEAQEAINLTVSLGIASFPSDATSIDKLVQAADAALYQAKEKGRNCSVLYAS